MGNRGHLILGWISQDSNMLLSYDRIWDSISQWTKVHCIRSGCRIGFWNLFDPFGLPKMICVDADELFSIIFNDTYQETLMILVHAVTRGNNKSIINKGFCHYLNKFQKINSADKVSLHQWMQGAFFALYAFNIGPVKKLAFLN